MQQSSSHTPLQHHNLGRPTTVAVSSQSSSLERQVLVDLPALSGSAGLAHASRLEVAVRRALDPVTHLSATLSRVFTGLSLLDKDGRRQSRSSSGQLSSSTLSASHQQSCGGMLFSPDNPLAARVAICVHMSGPWLSLSDRDVLCEVAQQVAGRDAYFGGSPGLWCMHLAAILYYERYGLHLETRFCKLNYTFNCPWTSQSSKSDPHDFLPECERGRRWVTVVGLPGHGRSALCGRLIQGLGQNSVTAQSRVQSAARRLAPQAAADAVWMVDRSTDERESHTNYYSKEIPLYMEGTGSLILSDTPASVGIQGHGRDLARSNLPRESTRYRHFTQSLCLMDPQVVIICVAVDLEWHDEHLALLVDQVCAASSWPHQTRLIFAVTRMDLLSWSEEAFVKTAQRIQKVVVQEEQDLCIIPTSAVPPAHGILRPCQTKGWKTVPAVPSIVAEMFTALSSKKPAPINQQELAEAVIVDEVKKHRTSGHEDGQAMFFVVVIIRVVKGSISVGQLLTPRRGLAQPVKVAKIEWFGRPCSKAYAGQVVGLRFAVQSAALKKQGSRPLPYPAFQFRYRILSKHSEEIEKYGPSSEDLVKSIVYFGCRLDPSPPIAGDYFMIYPQRIQFSKLSLSRFGEDYHGLELIGDGEYATRFHLGQRFVVYYRSGKGMKTTVKGVGVVVQVGNTFLENSDEYVSKLSLGPLPTTTQPSGTEGAKSSEAAAAAAKAVPPPLPLPRRISSSQRQISSASSLTLGLGEFHQQLPTEPARTINEAISQTEAALNSLIKVRDELEKTKEILEKTKHDERQSPCYMCRAPCSQSAHPDLIPICSICDDLNREKRSSFINMVQVSGSQAIVVTGARIKIGFGITSRLLQAGARNLVLTTRFPYCLAEKLLRDHPKELENAVVHIYGTDFRSVGSVMRLGDHIAKHYPEVFALINNAAQTIRRPPAFYRSILENEMKLARSPGALATLVKVVGENPFVVEEPPTRSLVPSQPDQDSFPVVKSFQDCDRFPECSSALMTQCQVTEEDKMTVLEGQDLFPPSDIGHDANTGEAVSDLREFTSWTKSLLPSQDTEETVHPIEMLEVLLVNTLAPFILLKSLCPALAAATGNVINVSSQEGIFSRVKNAEHPHTNAAKAGLNMLTRTAACELKKVKVMICSVDTGWVSNWNSRNKHRPPLTIDDGAARVLDPIRQRLERPEGAKFQTGVFWHNFKPKPFV